MDYLIKQADSHFNGSRYDKARSLYKDVLSHQCRTLGLYSHKTTLEIRRKTALTFIMQGKFNEAVAQYEIICRAYASKRDRDNIFLLQTKSELADVYKWLGKQNKAIELKEYIEEMLKCRAEAFEKLSKSDSAMDYFATVETYHKFALSHLGSYHETTVRMLEVLGDMHSLKGDNKNAWLSYNKVSSCLEQKNASDTENILRVQNKMALADEKEGLYGVALRRYKFISEVYKTRQPPDYISNWKTDYHIVKLSQKIGKQRQAATFFNCIKLNVKNFTDMFVELRNDLSSELYSEICRERCREIIERKFKLAMNAFEWMQSILPTDNEDIFRMKWVIGFMYHLLGRYKDSLQVFEEVYEESLSKYGPNHSLTINSCLDRVSLLRFLCDFQKAYAVLNDFFKKRKTFLKTENPMYDDVTLRIRYECGNIFYEEGSYVEALDIYKDIYTECKSNDELTLDARRMYAKTKFKVGHRETALAIIEQFYNYTQTLGRLNVGHLERKGLIRFLVDIADIKEQLGEYDCAVNIYESMKGIWEAEGIDYPIHIQCKKVIIRAKQDKGIRDHAKTFLGMIEECKKISKTRHFITSSMRMRLAAAYFDDSKREDILEIYQHLVAENEEMLGYYHLDTVNVKYVWAKCLADIRYPLITIKNMLEEIREIRYAILSHFHPDCLSVNYNLAEAYERSGLYDEAFKIYCDVHTKTELFYGASNLYLVEVKKRIDSIANRIREPNLIRATMEANLNELQSCLSNGDDVNLRGANGFTPLHIASQRGYTDIVKCLLNHGASYEIKNWERQTPADIACGDETESILLKVEKLFFSVKCNDVNSVKSIIQQENVLGNAKDNKGFSPLHIASYKGYKYIVKILLNSGADVKSRTLKGYLSLHLAAIKGDNSMILILVKHMEENIEDFQEMFNDNENVKGATPLHFAAAENRVETVYLLRHNHVYLEKRDKLGKLPIDLTTSKEIKDFLRKLLKFPNA